MSEELNELKEHAEHAKHDPTLAPVSLTMALLAVLVAVVSLLGHRAHTEEIVLQSKATDQWAFYQAKNMRRHVDELFTDLTSVQATVDAAALSKLREKYSAEANRYKDDQKDLDTEARALEAEVLTGDEASRPLRPGRGFPGNRTRDHFDHATVGTKALLDYGNRSGRRGARGSSDWISGALTPARTRSGYSTRASAAGYSDSPSALATINGPIANTSIRVRL